MKDALQRYLLELRVVAESLDERPFEALAGAIAARSRVFVAGLGRTGAVMSAFAARLNQGGFDAHVVLDPGSPLLQAGDLLLIGSGSGTTETMLAVAAEAARRRARVAVVTNNVLSPLGQGADETLLVPPVLPPDQPDAAGVASPVQATFEQALFLILDALAARIRDLAVRGRDPLDPR